MSAVIAGCLAAIAAHTQAIKHRMASRAGPQPALVQHIMHFIATCVRYRVTARAVCVTPYMVQDARGSAVVNPALGASVEQEQVHFAPHALAHNRKTQSLPVDRRQHCAPLRSPVQTPRYLLHSSLARLHTRPSPWERSCVNVVKYDVDQQGAHRPFAQTAVSLNPTRRRAVTHCSPAADSAVGVGSDPAVATAVGEGCPRLAALCFTGPPAPICLHVHLCAKQPRGRHTKAGGTVLCLCSAHTAAGARTRWPRSRHRWVLFDCCNLMGFMVCPAQCPHAQRPQSKTHPRWQRSPSLKAAPGRQHCWMLSNVLNSRAHSVALLLPTQTKSGRYWGT